MSGREIVNRENHEVTASLGQDLKSCPSETEPFDLRDLLLVLFRRRWVMLLALVVVFASGILYTLSKRPIYESSAKIVVVGSRNRANLTENDVSWLSDLQALTRSRSVDTQVEIISGTELLEEAYNTLDSRLRGRGFGGAALPGWAYRVTAKENTDVIVITGRAYDPVAAAALANNIAHTYFQSDLRENNQATRQARIYAQEKMALAAKDLARANAELSEFKRRTGFFAPETQLTKTAEQVAQMSLDLDAARTEAAASTREIASLRRQLIGEQTEVVTCTSVTRNPHFDAILSKIESLDSERIALLQEFTPDSPEVESIENRIKQEQARLKRFTETLVGTTERSRNPIRDTLLTKYASDVAAAAASEARVRVIGSELAARKREAQTLPEKERQFNELIQRATLLQRTHEMLSSKYYTLLLSEQAMLPNGMLVSRARVPSSPAYPNPRNAGVLFFFLGILAAVAAAMIVERFDCRIHDQPTAEQSSGLPTLTLVPLASRSHPIVGDEKHDFALLESFRILRNNIAFSSVERKLKIIGVTSPCRGEGKSTIVSNLAIAMGMEGNRILLVDADMRRSSLHRMIVEPSGSGLTTVLTDATRLEDTIAETRAKNVSCLPAGPTPPNPAEILNSQPSRELFRRLAQEYDVVLVDCPPALGLSDVQVLSTIVDGMLLVVTMDRTPKPLLQMAIRSLIQIGSPLIGLVLNKVDLNPRGYGYYYYYGYAKDYAKSDHSVKTT